MKYPRIVLRFNGERSTDKILVREATSRRTIAVRAREAAQAAQAPWSNGWCPVLVGTDAALLAVGAYVSEGGGWIWRDDNGFEIAVDEVQP